ncbi:hypothetical protein F444_08996 [Phytophthora nicotianae P1976]|uniref:Core-binding (CB) domain-containing protein n=1 Tax=Phytophthora nicotianae P1976 TaxID=1317066 RepID=A0A081A945_PHYNI|nr:hypothetical protein F444_08996 [Phytophthora nicotianae P1976]
MEGYDWVYLKDQVRQIRENTVTARSRTTYQNSYCHFLAWLLENKTHRIAPPFTECIEGIGTYTPQQLRTRVKEAINQDLRVDPLIFDTLAAEDFVIWLVTLKRKDDDALSYSALNTHRADLCDLFRDYGKTMSKRWSRSLPPISKGLKHTFATDASNEASEIKTDKDPLMLDLYSFLCGKMLALPGKKMCFSHTYIVIAWNLMCRSSNAFGIRHFHMV